MEKKYLLSSCLNTTDNIHIGAFALNSELISNKQNRHHHPLQLGVTTEEDEFNEELDSKNQTIGMHARFQSIHTT